MAYSKSPRFVAQAQTRLLFLVVLPKCVKCSLFPAMFLLGNFLGVPVIPLIAISGAAPVSAVSIASVSVNSQTPLVNLTEHFSGSPLSKPAIQQLVSLNSLPLPSSSSGKNSESRETSEVEGVPLAGRGLLTAAAAASSAAQRKSTAAAESRSRRSANEARVTSNQDVTTLALAMDNSSSVAIANINSSWNNVFVTIMNPPGSARLQLDSPH